MVALYGSQLIHVHSAGCKLKDVQCRREHQKSGFGAVMGLRPTGVGGKAKKQRSSDGLVQVSPFWVGNQGPLHQKKFMDLTNSDFS